MERGFYIEWHSREDRFLVWCLSANRNNFVCIMELKDPNYIPSAASVLLYRLLIPFACCSKDWSEGF